MALVLGRRATLTDGRLVSGVVLPRRCLAARGGLTGALCTTLRTGHVPSFHPGARLDACNNRAAA